jgi:hypothetical protein
MISDEALPIKKYIVLALGAGMNNVELTFGDAM